MPSFAQSLEKTLHSALSNASERSHEYATLEHLLLALIDDPETLDMKAAKPKALSVHWEFMFTRSMFQTEDMTAQRDLLNRVAQMIDAGRLQSTVTEHAGVINVENLRAAHLRQECGRVIGKQVLGGW